MFNLTWEQAIEAMREGKCVKNRFFSSEEFFHIKHGKIFDERGYDMSGWYRGTDWQQEGWMVIE